MSIVTAIGDSIVQSYDTGVVPYPTKTEQWLYRWLLRLGESSITFSDLTPFSGTGIDDVMTGIAHRFINAGISSNEAWNMRDRFATDVLGHASDYVIIQSTANDISHDDAAIGVTEGYIAEIYDLADAAHIKVIAMLTPPRNGFTEAKRDKLDALNTWTRAEAASRGYQLLDLFTPMESSPGSREMPTEWTDDGTHPNVLGYQAMADAVDVSLSGVSLGPSGGSHMGTAIRPIDQEHREAMTAIHGIVVSQTSSLALGTSALAANTHAGNTAFGYEALKVASGVVGPTAFGYRAGAATTSGIVTAFGNNTLKSNTTGYATAFGFRAGYTNTSGVLTAVGNQAAYYNTTGNATAVGEFAGNANTTGTITAVGYYAGVGNTTGSMTAVGYFAGRYLADGSTANETSTKATYIGHGTKASASSASNETAIGYNAIGGGSNTVRLGDAYVTNWLPGATNVCALGNATTAFTALYLSDSTDEYALTVNTSGALVITKQ